MTAGRCLIGCRGAAEFYGGSGAIWSAIESSLCATLARASPIRCMRGQHAPDRWRTAKRWLHNRVS